MLFNQGERKERRNKQARDKFLFSLRDVGGPWEVSGERWALSLPARARCEQLSPSLAPGELSCLRDVLN